MADKMYNREQVMEAVNSVVNKVNRGDAEPIKHIQAEIFHLAETLDRMHEEIDATRSHDVSDIHIPNATDELDAVVGATEKASATIMDAAEAMQLIADKSNDDVKDEIYAHTTKIFEACSFQDITGQRITNVIKALREIEGSVNNLLRLFGPVGTKDKQSRVVDTRNEDEKLMNGPQKEGEGVSQDDIDKLLADFD